MTPVPTTTKTLTVDEVVTAIASCNSATVESMKRGTQAAGRHEDRCYRDLFVLLVGRKPTPAELSRITNT